MHIIYVFVGIPGSGKTFLAKKYQSEYGGILLDDRFTKEQLIEAIKFYNYIYITDPYLCLPDTRNRFCKLVESLNIKIEWIYFENDLEKALYNIDYRNDGRIIDHKFVCELSNNYLIPNEVTTINIWTNIKLDIT